MWLVVLSGRERLVFCPECFRASVGRKEGFKAENFLLVWISCCTELTLSNDADLKAVTTKLNSNARITQMYFPFAASQCIVHVTGANCQNRLWITVSGLIQIGGCVTTFLMLLWYFLIIQRQYTNKEATLTLKKVAMRDEHFPLICANKRFGDFLSFSLLIFRRGFEKMQVHFCNGQMFKPCNGFWI